MRRVDFPTAVEVTFDRDGKPSIRYFTLLGKRVSVTGVGRTWIDDEGKHVLVMGPSNETYELLLRRSDLAWRVVGVPARSFVV